jgi:hypothetical protein
MPEWLWPESFSRQNVMATKRHEPAFARWATAGKKGMKKISFSKRMAAVKSDLEAEAYDVEVKARARPAVAAAFIRFRGLLHETGLSPHPDEKLSVKVEIDTRPPAGAGLATRVVRRHVLLHLLHYDRPSLLAGKLHAVLSRKYTKGRDLYDLAWYLSDPAWPPPNLELLNNALQQTSWSGRRLTNQTWVPALARRLEKVDWAAALADVLPFLERETPGRR